MTSEPFSDKENLNTHDKVGRNVKERQFKGLSLAERKQARREKLIEAGILAYGTHGFFSVTVKDICVEAKLTERYFYESFKKSEQLFQCIFLQLIETLQSTLMQAILHVAPDPKQMIHAGLTALFKLLKDNPCMARIIYIDAMLVQELHQQATIRETLDRFDRMIDVFVQSAMPPLSQTEATISLMATGLNGYVTQIAVRWVIDDFKQPLEEIVAISEVVFVALLEKFVKHSSV